MLPAGSQRADPLRPRPPSAPPSTGESRRRCRGGSPGPHAPPPTDSRHVWAFAELLERANGDRAQVEHACRLVGVAPAALEGKTVAFLVEDEDGAAAPEGCGGRAVRRGDIDLGPYKCGASDTDAIAMIRWAHEQAELQRWLVRVAAALDTATRGARSGGHPRSPTAESTRLLEGRRIFTQRVQRAVVRMRHDVGSQKEALAAQLERERAVDEERRRDAENRRIATQLSRQLQRAKMNEELRSAEDRRRRADEEAAAEAARRAAAEAAVGADVSAHRQRHLHHQWAIAAAAHNSAAARAALHDSLAQQADAERRQRAERLEAEARERDVAVRVRERLLHEMTSARCAAKHTHQDGRYDAATRAEQRRLKKLAEAEEAARQRHAQWQRAFTARARERCAAAAEREQGRRAAHRRAQDAEQLAREATDAENELRALTAQRQRDRRAARQREVQERARLASAAKAQRAAAAAAAREYREDVQRRAWLARKQQQEAEDAEITAMNRQLRYDRDQMGRRVRQLDAARRRGDIRRLDAFLSELDQRLGSQDHSPHGCRQEQSLREPIAAAPHAAF